LHRVGRTGRFGTDGLSLTLMGAELDVEMVGLLAAHYGIEINELSNFEQLTKIYTEMRGEADV
jgi:superfamily II DNA/RNA helicase